MAYYQLKISLLSDMCVSDGGAYNSMIDTDCCYDEYGFPFIPAKRIKGCLRECALELNDWGKNIESDKIFGEPGRADNGGQIRFGNACLENYSQLKKEAAANASHPLYHPQQILKQYTSLRTQTSISQETGVADPHSLRTMRTINKGCCFVAEIDMPDAYFDDLRSCCAVLRHMGIARTRGFGEVLVTIEPYHTKQVTPDISASHAALTPGADRLEYEITLEEPLICKSVAGGEARTQDYIEGSKVLGFVLGKIKRQKGQQGVLRFLEDTSLRFANAYIGTNDYRYTEVPAYIYSIKNNKEDYVNRLFCKASPDGIQLSQMKHCYVRMEKDKLHTLNVSVEDRYHHRRAEDKSIGRAAAGSGTSDFYQMSSICPGQNFYGYITGSCESIKEAYECLTGSNLEYLGYSRSVEYGGVHFRVIAADAIDQSPVKKDSFITGKTLLVKLESAAVIYNNKVMCSVDKTDLLHEVLFSLGIDIEDIADIDNIETYANFTTLGGFNVTWARRKPIIPAFDKGTSVCLPLHKEVSVPASAFIGERSLEGYGEISVMAIDSEQTGKLPSNIPDTHEKDYLKKVTESVKSGEIISSEEHVAAPSCISIAPGSLGEKLADSLFITFLGAKARKSADSFGSSIIKYRATISNLLVGFRDYKDLQEVQNMVDKRYGKRTARKEEKLTYAQNILDIAVKDYEKTKNDFCQEHYITDWNWTKIDETSVESHYQMVFLEELLIAMKHRIRSLTQGKNSEE